MRSSHSGQCPNGGGPASRCSSRQEETPRCHQALQAILSFGQCGCQQPGLDMRFGYTASTIVLLARSGAPSMFYVNCLVDTGKCTARPQSGHRYRSGSHRTTTEFPQTHSYHIRLLAGTKLPDACLRRVKGDRSTTAAPTSQGCRRRASFFQPSHTTSMTTASNVKLHISKSSYSNRWCERLSKRR